MGFITVTEPHPTVAKNDFTHGGRGGAGNYFRAPATTPASGVATQSMPLPPTTRRFHSGRGGAGNAQVAISPPAISLDEEYTRKVHIEEKVVGHVGRGGAGNVYGAEKIGSSRKPSDASSHRSASSAGSTRSGFWGRLSNSHSRP